MHGRREQWKRATAENEMYIHKKPDRDCENAVAKQLRTVTQNSIKEQIEISLPGASALSVGRKTWASGFLRSTAGKLSERPPPDIAQENHGQQKHPWILPVPLQANGPTSTCGEVGVSERSECVWESGVPALKSPEERRARHCVRWRCGDRRQLESALLQVQQVGGT